MGTRRDFLKINLGAASAAVLYPVSAHSTGVDHKTSEPLFAFLYDTRITEADFLAKNMAGRAQKNFSADRDLAAIWMDDLCPQISATNTYIAGITEGYHAFSLQEAARDYGHSILHSEHFDIKRIKPDSTGTMPCKMNENCIDQLSLNTSEAVFWLLGPSGINFHS